MILLPVPVVEEIIISNSMKQTFKFLVSEDNSWMYEESSRLVCIRISFIAQSKTGLQQRE